MSEQQSYFLTPEFVQEWDRIRAKVDGMSGERVQNTLTGITISPPNQPPQMVQGLDQPDMVLVAIVGPEMYGGDPVPGRYQGSILSGNDVGLEAYNGGTLNPPEFAYRSLFPLSGDGPNFKAASGSRTDGDAGTPVVNALVINLPEALANLGNVLWTPQATDGTSPNYVLCIGKIMGVTKETNPRQIVYVEQWPVYPVVAQLTGVTGGTVRAYLGKIVQGPFAQWNRPIWDINSLAAGNVPASENAIVFNDWEFDWLGVACGALPTGSFCVFGTMIGVCAYNPGAGTEFYYMVHTYTAPQATNPAGAGNTPTITQLYTALRDVGVID